jgi:hypothetical protein
MILLLLPTPNPVCHVRSKDQGCSGEQRSRVRSGWRNENSSEDLASISSLFLKRYWHERAYPSSRERTKAVILENEATDSWSLVGASINNEWN